MLKLIPLKVINDTHQKRDYSTIQKLYLEKVLSYSIMYSYSSNCAALLQTLKVINDVTTST